VRSCGRWTADEFVPLPWAVSGGLTLRCHACRPHPAFHGLRTHLGSIKVGASDSKQSSDGRERGMRHVVGRPSEDSANSHMAGGIDLPNYPPTGQSNRRCVGQRRARPGRGKPSEAGLRDAGGRV
jgi:hypothetical protein